MTHAFRSLVYGCALLAVTMGCRQAKHTPESTSAALYLAGAEIQAETPQQREALRKALDDMLSLTPDQLRQTRYGSEHKTLPALLRTHIVPPAPVPAEDNDFYAQAENPKVRAAVEILRAKLNTKKPM